MSIAVRQVTKRFDNGFVAVDSVSLAIAGGSLTACSSPAAAASPPCSGSSPGSRRHAGDVSILGQDVTGVPPQARRRLRLPALRGLQHMTVRDNVALG